MSILIVDDSDDLRVSLGSVLKAEGIKEVHAANSAAQAYELLGMTNGNRSSPGIDVILMDIRMPQIDGIEACRQIKARERLRDIPIIMVTAATEGQDLESAFAAGAIEYITKPVKIAELMARLRAMLTLKHELDCRKAREQQLKEVTLELQEANRALMRLSNLDELTGLANRRHFNQILGQEWSRTMRRTSCMSLIMIDVDFFKAYNDHYGHPSGDECLRRVAAVIHGALRRPTDLVARYGGEEFAVVLPNTNGAGALTVAEAIRRSVERLLLPHEGSPQEKVTISLGVATTDSDWPWTPDTLITAADRALYEAKRKGRNRIEAFDGFEAPTEEASR